WVWAIGKRYDVGADRRVKLLQQLLAATIFVPGQQRVAVHPERRPGAPQGQRILLSVVVYEHAVTAIERSLRHGFQQAERRHDSARRQHLDPELATGHVVHFLREVERVLVKDIFRW